MRQMFLCLALALFAAPAAADGFEPVREKDRFLSIVKGKELRIGLYQLSLKISPDGSIAGRALGWDINGKWSWKDGYFCREMDWSGYPIPQNCQLVEVKDGREMRFTVDQGKGDSASFRLR